MMKNMIRSGFFLILVSVSACGYQFSSAGKLVGNVTDVNVAMFENESAETGAETIFSNAFIGELVRRSGADVVDKKRAEAFITARITSINIGALTRTSDDEVLERRVTAVVDLKMVTRQGEVLFSVKGFSEDDEYSVSHSNVSDDFSRRTAIEKIAVSFAEKMVSRLKDDF